MRVPQRLGWADVTPASRDDPEAAPRSEHGERSERYRRAIAEVDPSAPNPVTAVIALAVMAVADAEQDALRAEVERLEGIIIQHFPTPCWCGYDPEDLPASDIGGHVAHSLAELRAEVERLKAGLYPLGQHTIESSRALAEDIGSSEDSLFVGWIRQRQRAESAEAERDRLSETVARVEALREEIRAEQNRCCAYGTTHGDGRTCDCKFPFPGRTNSEASGCPERRRFIDQIDRALTGPTETVARVEAQVRHDERGEVQTRLDDLLGFLSDDGRYGYHQHPQEVCGPDHHVCALVSHLMNAVIDPDWLNKMRAAKERTSRATGGE